MQLLTAQKIISTKQFQSKFAQAVREAEKSGEYYNVVKNSKSIGVFMPKKFWESLMEDLEALSSPNYLKKIEESRKAAKNGKFVDLDDLLKDEN